MFMKGAKSVCAFDVNSLSMYYYEFLKAFIKSGLDFSSYRKLFIKSFGNKDNTYKIAQSPLQNPSSIEITLRYCMINMEVVFFLIESYLILLLLVSTGVLSTMIYLEKRI